jgi:hypothetical protein
MTRSHHRGVAGTGACPCPRTSGRRPRAAPPAARPDGASRRAGAASRSRSRFSGSSRFRARRARPPRAGAPRRLATDGQQRRRMPRPPRRPGRGASPRVHQGLGRPRDEPVVDEDVFVNVERGVPRSRSPARSPFTRRRSARSCARAGARDRVGLHEARRAERSPVPRGGRGAERRRRIGSLSDGTWRSRRRRCVRSRRAGPIDTPRHSPTACELRGVKLLVDANLSPALVSRLRAEYPAARTSGMSGCAALPAPTSGTTRRLAGSASCRRTRTSASAASSRVSRRRSCGWMWAASAASPIGAVALGPVPIPTPAPTASRAGLVSARPLA